MERVFSDPTEFSAIDTVCLHPKANHIGLLGGTFNPVHNGHIRMACIALDEFMLGEVVFIPAGNPPHKRSEAIAPAEHRVNMLRLAIQDESRFSINTLEIDREGLTYTVDTLETLRHLHPGNEYNYIIGADTLYELPGWRNFERVIALTCFICVLRPGVADIGAYEFAQALN
ncbi:MAG: nicotinate-nucleotide adenylyltransferase, partial [Anaerolineaceae bacterium]